MIDAYEIGIRLALENGVSEGIAIIKRDLTALDAAIAKSAAGLIDLQGLAGSLVGYGVAAARAPATRALTPPPSPPESIDTPTTSAAPRPTRVDGGLGERSSGMPALSTSPAPLQGPAVAPVSERAPIEQQQITPRSPERASTAQPADTLTPKRYPPDTPPAAPARQPPQASSGSDTPALRETPRSAPVFVNATASVPVREPIAPQEAPPADQVRNHVRRPSMVAPDRATAAPVLRPYSAPSGAAATPIAYANRSPSSPTAPRSVAPVAPPAVRPATPVQQERADPPARPASSQEIERRPTEGHIYLEGAVLGRWLSDHLSRAATRPRSGSTNFDPRISPAWPGAPVGS